MGGGATARVQNELAGLLQKHLGGLEPLHIHCIKLYLEGAFFTCKCKLTSVELAAICFKGARKIAMEPASAPSGDKPLACWKTWWGPQLPLDIAQGLKRKIDPAELPGKGVLLQLREPNKVSRADLEKQHTCVVAEALLLAYRLDKQPSGYLLGDAAMALNAMYGHGLFGPPQPNPLKEQARRSNMLREGSKMKLLLSYVRTRATKNEQGKSDAVCYLKELANKRKPYIKSPARMGGSSSKSSLSDLMSPSSNDAIAASERFS